MTGSVDNLFERVSCGIFPFLVPLSLQRHPTTTTCPNISFGFTTTTTTTTILPSSSSSSLIPISLRFTTPISSLTPLLQLHADDNHYVDSPLSVDLIPISTDSHFHQLLSHSQHPLIILWMANWCRNCIYLKPKLEKMAAQYYPRLQFYSIDVNTVSHKLVAHAGVTKMPTIQLWKDGEKHAEVIGGRKAHWVISEVQEMIENECSM